MTAPRTSLGHLPAPMSSLVGRDADVAAALALLRTPYMRWLTLVGPGGIGKTRVAIAVAEALQGEVPDRVRWVDLIAVHHPDEVVARIAEVVGIQQSTSESSAAIDERLSEVLGNGRWVLVLDNLEHVITAAPAVTAILRRARFTQILATSRMPARIEGEHLRAVGPLPVTVESGGRPLPERASSAAARLFAHRAIAVDPTFALTDETMPVVDAICRKLDGLPLAIELAASRLRQWTPDELLTKLDDRFAVLTDGPIDVADHRRSLRATFDWSRDLLSADAAMLLRRLSIPRGAIDFALATELYGEGDAASALRELERASFVFPAPGERRSAWQMLETVRAYALEQLETAGEVAPTSERFAAWCLDLAERLGPRAFVHEQDAAFDELEANRRHLSDALAWFDAHQDVARYRRLATALRNFWFVRAHYEIGRRVLERARALTPDPSALELGRIQQGLAMLDLAQQLPGPALEGFLAADPLLRAGDALPREIAIGQLGASTAAFYAGQIDRATALQAEALATVADRDPECHAALAIARTANLAFLTGLTGDFAGSRALFEQVQEQQATTGVTWYLSIGWLQLGTIAELHGQLEDALAAYQQGVGIALQRHRDLRLVADGVAGAASVAFKRGQPDQAARLLGAEAMLQVKIGGEISYITSFMDRHHATRTAVREALGDQAYAALMRDGANLGEDELAAAIGSLDVDDEPEPLERALPYGLTAREFQIWKLLAAGRTSAEIAYLLPPGRTKQRIAEKTVEKHITNLYRKLQVSSRVEAAALAIRDGHL